MRSPAHAGRTEGVGELARADAHRNSVAMNAALHRARHDLRVAMLRSRGEQREICRGMLIIKPHSGYPGIV